VIEAIDAPKRGAIQIQEPHRPIDLILWLLRAKVIVCFSVDRELPKPSRDLVRMTPNLAIGIYQIGIDVRQDRTPWLKGKEQGGTAGERLEIPIESHVAYQF